MPHAHQHGSHVATQNAPVYRPTSLDFINRPNPIEPQSESHRHPLNGTLTPQQLSLPSKARSRTTRQEFLSRLLEPTHRTAVDPHDDSTSIAFGEPPAKRRKSRDSTHGRCTVISNGTNNTSLDLPKPSGRQVAKRLLLPPTLSGLHQPPPNAGLLPSISIEQPATVTVPLEENLDTPSQEHHEIPKVGPSRPDNHVTTTSLQEADQQDRSSTGVKVSGPSDSKLKRRKWGEEETACLLKGVARFGIGNWTKILMCEDYEFNRRTALDLKDRFRVCCPNDYRKPATAALTPQAGRRIAEKETNDTATSREGNVGVVEESAGSTSGKTRRTTGARSDRKSSQELQDLGINVPFAPTKRRKRHTYTMTEDSSLLQGFKKHGNAWAAIRDDESLGLGARTATDLRDRMRTRYPDEYKDSGLAGRPKDFPKRPQRGEKGNAHANDDPGNDTMPPSDAKDGAQANTSSGTTAHDTNEHGKEDRNHTAQGKHPTIKVVSQPKQRDSVPSLPAQPAKRAAPLSQPSSLLPYDHDVFFGASMPFDGDEDYGGDEAAKLITLDRGILDWPLDNYNNKALASGATTAAGTLPAMHTVMEGMGSIDPAMTLVKLPLLQVSGTTNGVTSSMPLLSQNQIPSTHTAGGGGAGFLPSLAAVTALVSGCRDQLGVEEQLELPSLMLGGLEGDVHRVGGLGLDELLS